MSTKQLTKMIPLTKGQFAIVDFSDFEWLNQWKWCAHWRPQTRRFYAVRNTSVADGIRRLIRMHRALLDAPVRILVDHRNGNTLDNRRSNLRLCSNSQNLANQRARSTGTSLYKGVCWHKALRKWVAHIKINRKQIYLGVFLDEREAAIEYNKAALRDFKDFALLNVV